MEKIKRVFMEGVWAVRSLSNFPLYFAGRLGMLGDDSVIIKFRNGVRYHARPRLGEFQMIEEIWNRAVYDPLLYLIKDGSTVVDIGANIGIFSIKAAHAAKNVHIVACEPI